MVSIVTVCCQSYYSIIDYVSYAEHDIPMIYLLYSWSFYLLVPFT